MVNNEPYEDNECLYLGSLFLGVHAHTPNDDDWMAQANVLPRYSRR